LSAIEGQHLAQTRLLAIRLVAHDCLVVLYGNRVDFQFRVITG